MQKTQDMEKPQITKRKAMQNLNPDPALIEQPAIELKPSALKMVELDRSHFLDSLRRELPVELSKGIEEKVPDSIYMIPSRQGINTGFNTFMWRDQKGSTLFLDNLDSKGTVNKSLMVTEPQFQSLAKKSGLKKKPLDTIFVKSKLAGDAQSDLKSRMAAKTMVLGLLDFYQKYSIKNFESPIKPILKETKAEETKTDFVITFSVKGITQIEPIMDPYSLLISDDRLAKTLSYALTSYRDKLKAGVVNGFRVEEVAAMGGAKEREEASRMVKEIAVAADSLETFLTTEIDKWKLTYPKPTDRTEKDLATLKTLHQQVVLAIKDGFRNELDTRRWQQWRTLKPMPLTEDQIVPGTGTKIGEGAQGPVFKYELDPASGRSPVVLKYDSNGLNMDAKGAGIPELNPQQSVRAVTAFNISEHLKLGVIPWTEFFVGTDDNGRPKLGQAMEVVNGPVGQRKALLKNDAFTDEKVEQLKLNELLTQASKPEPLNDEERSAKAEAQKQLGQFSYIHINGKWYQKPPIDQNRIDKLEADQALVARLGELDPQKRTGAQQGLLEQAQERLGKYEKVNGQWYHAEIFPVNIDYGNPVVQKGLSDLQVFDYIIGHADRNPGNWIYEKDKNGHIIRVKGIDNDDTFGEKWRAANPNATFFDDKGSKTPGVPPIVDISTALSILNADFAQHIQPLLAGLSDEEIKIAAHRFEQVQLEVVQRVRDGKIASMGDDAAGDQAKLGQLRQVLPDMPAELEIKIWGHPDIAAGHTEQNSYLGFQIAQKEQFGVAPESGLGLALLPGE